MRADRLVSLLLLLQSRGRMTAQALAEHLEVSERTIYRDIEALSFAGVPLYTERGPGGGCELLNGYQSRLTGLTTPEVRALFLLSSCAPLVDLGLEQALKDALLKLFATLPAPSREHAEQARRYIHIDTTYSTHSREGIAYLELLQEAIWQETTVYLTYRGYCRRGIDPYGLVLHHGTWYLVGASAGILHIVCVADIRAAALTGQHFARPTTFNLTSYWTEHISSTDHTHAAGRNRQPQKKAKTKVGVSTHASSQKNFRTSAGSKKGILLLSRLHHDRPCFYYCRLRSSNLFGSEVVQRCGLEAILPEKVARGDAVEKYGTYD